MVLYINAVSIYNIYVSIYFNSVDMYTNIHETNGLIRERLYQEGDGLIINQLSLYIVLFLYTIPRNIPNKNCFDPIKTYLDRDGFDGLIH